MNIPLSYGQKVKDMNGCEWTVWGARGNYMHDHVLCFGPSLGARATQIFERRELTLIEEDDE